MQNGKTNKDGKQINEWIKTTDISPQHTRLLQNCKMRLCYNWNRFPAFKALLLSWGGENLSSTLRAQEKKSKLILINFQTTSRFLKNEETITISEYFTLLFHIMIPYLALQYISLWKSCPNLLEANFLFCYPPHTRHQCCVYLNCQSNIIEHSQVLLSMFLLQTREK